MAGKPVSEEQQRPGYRKVEPVYVLKVETKDGKVLQEYTKPTQERVVDPAPMYLLNKRAERQRPAPRGFGSYANYLTLPDRLVGAKTGTTNMWLDAWTMGYTPQLAVGVWTGNADNKPMKLADGSITAAPIMHRVLSKGVEGLPVQAGACRRGSVRATVCSPSGLLPSPTARRRRATSSWPARHRRRRTTFTRRSRSTRRTASGRLRARRPTRSSGWCTRCSVERGGLRARQPGTQPPVEVDGPCAARAGGRRGDRQPVHRRAVKARWRSRATRARRTSEHTRWRSTRTGSGWGSAGARRADLERAARDLGPAGFDGLYTLRLVVMENNGNAIPYEMPVVVDNGAPIVKWSTRRPTTSTRWRPTSW